MRIYRNWDDVEAHMMELINSKIPYEGTAKDGRKCILIARRFTDCGQLICTMIRYPNEPGYGQEAFCDCEDFQETEWKPADIPESEWRQYL